MIKEKKPSVGIRKRGKIVPFVRHFSPPINSSINKKKKTNRFFSLFSEKSKTFPQITRRTASPCTKFIPSVQERLVIVCSINSRFKLKVSFSFFFLVSSSSPNLLFGSGFIVHDGNLSHSSSELFLNLFQFSCSSGSVRGSIKGSIFAIGSLDVGSSQLSATQVRKQQYPPNFAKSHLCLLSLIS